MSGTEVYILGQKYTIKGDASEEHILTLTRYIDEQIKAVCSKSPNITPTKALILALFNIADEIHRLKAEQEDIASQIEEKANLLTRLL